MPRRTRRLFPALAVALAACAAPTPEAERPTATLLPLAPTPSVTTAPAELVVQPTAGPSPTPFTHMVEQGDTLLGIAVQYGVELNDLLVANAGINPRFLSVGQAILIPRPGGEPAAGLLPTATPVPVELSPVACFRMLEGAVWCLCTARNRTEAAVEGIGALITLGDADGEPLRSEPAYTPLNLLRPGELQLLAAYFSAPVPQFELAQAALVSAVSAADLERRYAALALNLLQSNAGPGAETWDVAGEVELADGGEIGPLQVHVAAFAFDAQGRPVGFAKHVLQAEPKAAFSFTVASLGPPIAGVEVSAEALVTLEPDA